MAHILLIDDDQGTRESSQLLLRAYGHECAVAADGRSGIALACAAEFDLILVDLNLPDISGIEVLAALSSASHKAVKVLTTAFPNLDSHELARAHGAAAIFAGILGEEDFIRMVALIPTDEPRHTRSSSRLSDPIPQVGSGSLRELDSRIASAVRTIHGTPSVWCVTSISAALGLSESRLQHLFAARAGMSLSRFARVVRLAWAARLLLCSNLSVTEVQLALGLWDTRYFRNLFRRRFGLSPSAYRRKFRFLPGFSESQK